MSEIKIEKIEVKQVTMDLDDALGFTMGVETQIKYYPEEYPEAKLLLEKINQAQDLLHAAVCILEKQMGMIHD